MTSSQNMPGRKATDSPAVASASFNRQTLHDLVWTKPLTSVASELGISRNGLAKICDRLHIPYPGRGYWSKRVKDARPPLPPPPPDVEDTITISPGTPRFRRRRTWLHKQARADQLLEAAGQIIQKEGLTAASMKRIAQDVGISEAQAHNHFSRRIDLLVTLARRELNAMKEARVFETERGHDPQTRITLSTIAYLREVEKRGPLLQILLDSPDVRDVLRRERKEEAHANQDRLTKRMNERYGVPKDFAKGTTIILNALCLRAGRLLAERKIPLHMAETLCVAMLNAGNRRIVRRTGRGRATAKS